MEQKEKEYYKSQVNNAVVMAHAFKKYTPISIPIYTVDAVYPDGNRRTLGKVMWDSESDNFINYCYAQPDTLATRMNLEEITRFIIGAIDNMRKETYRDFYMEVCFLGGEVTVPVRPNKEE